MIDTPSGFAGSAAVLWAGLAGLLIGALAGIVVLKEINVRYRLAVLICLGLGAAGAISWFMFRMNSVKNAQDQGWSAPTPSTHFTLTSGTSQALARAPLAPIGMGMAKPYLSDSMIFYFYGDISTSRQDPAYRIMDSLMISLGPYSYQIDYAPPWFEPEHLKLDYEILFFHTKTITRDFLEVIVNKTTGQTAWITTESAEYLEWSRFLLNVYDVEILDPLHNPVKIKPLLQAGKVVLPDLLSMTLQPIAVQGDWIELRILDEDLNVISKGWIRWKSGDKMMIAYSLLS